MDTFRQIFDEGIIPSLLKLGSITPILKSVSPSTVSNYRPILIESHITKIFESLVLNDIHRSNNNIIIEEQHRFRPGWSTLVDNWLVQFILAMCYKDVSYKFHFMIKFTFDIRIKGALPVASWTVFNLYFRSYFFE